MKQHKRKKMRIECKLKDDDQPGISNKLIKKCKLTFNSNPINKLKLNTVISVGSLFSSTNYLKAREISHIFLNSVKKDNVKVTDQGNTGRCWIFAGLNLFRHTVINALKLTNFEFSETYIFFWDKFEKCNTILQYFIDNPNVNENSRIRNFMLQEFLDDGGYFNSFSNIVKKYGIIPKNAMEETYNSNWSDDINNSLHEKITFTSYLICSQPNQDNAVAIKDSCLSDIYNILVQYLGKPPEKFNWFFQTEDNSNAITDLTPKLFTNMVLPDINIDDFIIFINIPPPALLYYTTYKIKNTSNLYNGTLFTGFNVPFNEIQKYILKSLNNKLPVWFAGDISKGFAPHLAALDEEIVDESFLFENFENLKNFKKADKIKFFNLESNHAMTITGYNVDNYNNYTWQIENSWGFIDNEQPGLDGFLYMSNDWLKKNVTQLVFHKKLLSRSIKKNLSQSKPILLEPFNWLAPSFKIKPTKKQLNYLKINK